MKRPKIALAHEFLAQFGGAEKTLEAIAEIYPEAPIYTAKYTPETMPESIKKRKIIAPKNGLVNRAAKFFFTFMMAPVFESFNFDDYDIIVSDGNTWNKGILTKPNQLHITYIHTPPRFLYHYSTENTKRDKWYFKLFFSYIDNLLRIWDYVAAQRPDFILTNSKETQKRIQKFYRRNAVVIYPPVDVNHSTVIENKSIQKPYYVAVGRLIKYKNFDLLIQAFNMLGLPLMIIGDGAYARTLKGMASENITFMGRISDTEKHRVLSNALGLINPVKDEDFGIVPVEAMAHGIPVLAHDSGGHRETVIEGVNGMFFSELTVESIVNAMKTFDNNARNGAYDKNKIRQSAERFSKERFKEELKQFVEEKWNNFSRA
ncbi:hypothetical protein A2619_01945 [candidate division WWE3 bacterium RIFOXYD1_FULL_39_9]|uniref:Glycosyl transferase family 1 domain-containing protein n=1 Tax=candidate division WWE3 bacterium RIFOXYD1_FULL_39_9 TaxID=1802649 RepID=A0A1F4X753_UNCKA|nr:MAG: hypothetical protein A2619_01945 [candidate division WWE3 bacterium RIFOXYD1_FULL_39_9]